MILNGLLSVANPHTHLQRHPCHVDSFIAILRIVDSLLQKRPTFWILLFVNVLACLCVYVHTTVHACVFVCVCVCWVLFSSNEICFSRALVQKSPTFLELCFIHVLICVFPHMCLHIFFASICLYMYVFVRACVCVCVVQCQRPPKHQILAVATHTCFHILFFTPRSQHFSVNQHILHTTHTHTHTHTHIHAHTPTLTHAHTHTHTHMHMHMHMHTQTHMHMHTHTHTHVHTCMHAHTRIHTHKSRFLHLRHCQTRTPPFRLFHLSSLHEAI